MSHSLNVYTVRDKKAGAYLQPFYAMSHAVAERIILGCVSSPDHQFRLFPEDYALYFVGVFDTSTGKIDASDSPEHIVNIDNLKIPKNAERILPNDPTAKNIA